MKYLSLALIFMTSLAYASTNYNKCCLCVTDLHHKFLKVECNKWFKDNKKKLGCEFTQTFKGLNGVNKFKNESNNSCKEVEVYGALHGQSQQSYLPFMVSRKFAETLSPEKINYDGSSCLFFNNLKNVKYEAEKLSYRFPHIEFNIAANQNMGMVRYYPLLSYVALKPVEYPHTTSKYRVHLKDHQATYSFDNCSTPKKSCAYYSLEIKQDYLDEYSDPNEKFCMDQGIVKTQKCCPKKFSGGFGQWADVGKDC